MKKVAVYARVSSDEQAKEGTIAVQLHEVEKYSEEHGYEVVAQFLDEGVSGAIPLADRPGGKALLEAAEAQRGGREKDFDAVLIYGLDRLGRDALVALLALERLKQLRLPVLFVREAFDDTPAGKFQQTVMSAVSELERALITQRMKGGRQRAVREGGKYLSATVPFGYRRDPAVDDRGRPCGRLIIDEEQARVVRDIFRWAREGLGLKQIQERLDAEGIAPPMANHWSEKRRARYGGWSWSTVAKLLANPRYIGEATYAGTPMACPAIIDREDFELARQAVAKRKFDSTRNTQNNYVLRGLLYCRTCGARFQGRTKSLKDGGIEVLYQCARRRSYGPKSGHEGVVWIVREAEILPTIRQAVDVLLADPQRAISEYEVLVEREREKVAGAEEHEAELREKLAELPVREERLAAALTRGSLAADIFDKVMADIRAERRELEAELGDAADVVEDAELAINLFTAIADQIRSGEIATGTGKLYNHATGEWLAVEDEVFDEERGEWVPTAALSPADARKRLETVVEKVWVEPDGSLTLEGPGLVALCQTPRRTGAAAGWGSQGRWSRSHRRAGSHC